MLLLLFSQLGNPKWKSKHLSHFNPPMLHLQWHWPLASHPLVELVIDPSGLQLQSSIRINWNFKCKKVLISNTLIQNSCQSSWKQEEGSEDYQAELCVHVDQLRTYQTLKHRLESHRTRNFRNNINLYFMKWKTRSINLKSMRCNNWGPFLRVAKTRISSFLQKFFIKVQRTFRGSLI